MVKTDIVFRNKITVSDYIRLRKTTEWKELSVRQVRAGLKNSVAALSAKINGETIGMARVVGDRGYVMLVVDVVVVPAYRRQGVATRMIAELMRLIEASVKDGEGVMLQLMAAKGLEGFYSRFGFRARPNEENGAGMTQWIEGGA